MTVFRTERAIDKQLLEKPNRLDIQESDILDTPSNEGTAGGYVITHEDGEELISALRIFQINTTQDAVGWIQRGLPQLRRVHLTQTLVALDAVILVDLAARIKAFLQQLITLGIRVGITWLALAPLELVQRWVSQVDVAFLDQLRHEAEEQGEQQRGDVLAVNVGVGHQHNLVVAQLSDIKFFMDTRAQRSNNRLNLGVFQHLVHACLLDVQDLAT